MIRRSGCAGQFLVPVWIVIALVSHQRPSDDQDLSRQGDGRFLFSGLFSAVDSIVRCAAPIVVLKRAPGTLNQ